MPSANLLERVLLSNEGRAAVVQRSFGQVIAAHGTFRDPVLPHPFDKAAQRGTRQ